MCYKTPKGWRPAVNILDWQLHKTTQPKWVNISNNKSSIKYLIKSTFSKIYKQINLFPDTILKPFLMTPSSLLKIVFFLFGLLFFLSVYFKVKQI